MFITIFAVITLLSACGGAEERKTAYFEKGKALYSQEKYEKARLDFQNTLQIDPNHVEARFMLAQVLEKIGEPKSAAGHYKRVIELDPNHVLAKSRLSRIYILGGAKDKAKKLAKEVLVLDSKNVTAMTVLATITSIDGDVEKAIEQARKALAIDPENNDTIALLSSLYVKNEQQDEAIKLLTNTIERSNDSSFKVVMASILVDQKKYEGAIAVLKDLIADDPTKLVNVARLSSLYSKVKREEEAEKLLRNTVDLTPDSDDAKMLLVNYLATNQDIESAEAELKKYIEADEKNYELRFGLAKLYNQAAKYSEEVLVYKGIIQVDDDGPAGLKAKNALAVRYLSENKVDEAKVLINEVLDKNSVDNESLKLRGMIALSDNNYESAISDFRSVLRDQPGLTFVRKLLVKAHIQKKEFGLAKDNLQTILDNNKNDIDARITLASVLSNLNSSKESLEETRKVLTVSPKNIVALELLFKHQFSNNDLEDSKNTAKLIKATYPKVALGYYLSGLVDVKNNKFQNGIDEFNLAVDKQPTAIEPLNHLISLLLSQKEYKRAIAKLDKIIDQHPDYVVARNLKGEVLMISGKNDAAKNEFVQVLDLNPKLVTPYNNLASMKIKQGNIKAALDIYKNAIKSGADKITMQFQMANLYQQSNDNAKAIMMYEDILKEKPNLDVAINNLAMLLSISEQDKEKNIKRALELTAKLANTENPSYLDTIGWTYYRSGDFQKALPYFDKALAIVPNEPLLLYHAGMTLYDIGDLAQAKVKLEKSVKSKKLFLGRNEATKTLEKISASNTQAMN